MGLLIKNGKVINADRSFNADVYCEDGKIVKVGHNIDIASDTEVIDAKGSYIMPGGIDPHTHMQLPFMGTEAIDDFESGTAAALAGGTTSIIDFVIPGADDSLLDAYKTWSDWASKSCCDYTFHVAVTKWTDNTAKEMETLVKEHGVNSFKHFMAYKGAMMCDDEVLYNSFEKAKELGAIVSIHAENGELVDRLQKKIKAAGITGPEGHPQSRPPEIEGEAANRGIQIALTVGVPLYVVHTSCIPALQAITRARTAGQTVYGEVLSQHLVIDESVYYNKDWRFAAHHVMSPPFRAKEHQAALWAGLKGGMLQTTATDNCTFCTEQKEMGKDDFTKIPNGTNGVEDRLSVIWEHGVNTGRLTPNEFVAVTSTNTAKIFNMYPKKGVIVEGADADIVVWDPNNTRTISAKTHRQKVDFNIYEGMECKGNAIYTISRGVVRYAKGELKAVSGSGKYFKRAPFSEDFKAMQRWYELNGPEKVSR